MSAPRQKLDLKKVYEYLHSGSKKAFASIEEDLKAGYSPDIYDYTGVPLLSVAILLEKDDLVNLLIEKKADLGLYVVDDPELDSKKYPELDFDSVYYHIARKLDFVKPRIRNCAPIHVALSKMLDDSRSSEYSSEPKPQYLKILLEKGNRGLVDYPEEITRNTPLMHAAQHLNFDVVKMLLEYKANPLAQNQNGKTALDLAQEAQEKLVWRSHWTPQAQKSADIQNNKVRKVICLLLEDAMEKEIRTPEYKEQQTPAEKKKIATDRKRLALGYLDDFFTAIQQGNKEQVEKLLTKKDFDIDVAAPKNALSSDYDKLYRVLKHQGVSVPWGSTGLHVACQEGKKEIAELLINNQATVDSPNVHGDSPLHMASKSGETECVKLLIEHKATVDSGYERGHTPLHVAIQSRNIECAKLLLEHKAYVDSGHQNRYLTPLHDAIVRRDSESAKLLIEYKAHVNVQNPKTPIQTLLYLAIRNEDPDNVKLLLENKADLKQEELELLNKLSNPQSLSWTRSAAEPPPDVKPDPRLTQIADLIKEHQSSKLKKSSP